MLITTTFLLYVTAGVNRISWEQPLSFSWRLDNVSAETCEATGKAMVARLEAEERFQPRYGCMPLTSPK